MKKIILLILFIIPLDAQLVPFNGYIDSDSPISGSYLIEVTMTNLNNQTVWSENFNNHDIIDGYYSLVLGENGDEDLSSIDFDQTLYLNVNIPSLSFNESDIPLYSTFSSIQSMKNVGNIVTTDAYTDLVLTAPGSWVTLLEVDITLPEEMMLCSFGTVSGFGFVDGWRMLQLATYDENGNWYGFSNPWGDVAAAYHILPAGTYVIQLYGLNLNDEETNMHDIAIHAFALPLDNRQESNVRVGPFEPPANANLPNPDELLNKIK